MKKNIKFLIFSLITSFVMTGCGENNTRKEYEDLKSLVNSIENLDDTLLDEIFTDEECRDFDKVDRYISYSHTLNEILQKVCVAGEYFLDKSGSGIIYTGFPAISKEEYESITEEEIKAIIASTRNKDANELLSFQKNKAILAINAVNDFLNEEAYKIEMDACVRAINVVIEDGIDKDDVLIIDGYNKIQDSIKSVLDYRTLSDYPTFNTNRNTILENGYDDFLSTMASYKQLIK